MEDLEDSTACKRRTAREHLEQDGARREQITAGVDGFAGYLFGRHVARGTHHDSGRVSSVAVLSDRSISGLARPKSSTFTPWG